jgi:iron complex transport system substrate-binding protein
LEQAGVTVLVLPVGGGLSDLRDVYSAVGLAFEGVFTGAESGQEAFSVISRACDNKDVVNLGKFIYITGDFKAATGDTLEDAILSCFGENLASGGEDYEFDFSLLLENQPDIILLSNKFTEDDLLEEEYLSRLDAVLQGRIIFIDNSFFERPSARLTWLIEKMLADYAAMGR